MKDYKMKEDETKFKTQNSHKKANKDGQKTGGRLLI